MSPYGDIVVMSPYVYIMLLSTYADILSVSTYGDRKEHRVEIRTSHALGAAARGQRLKLRLTQAALADAAGVSRAWVTEFEAGKPTVEVGRALAVIAALGLTLDLQEPHTASTEEESTDLETLLRRYGRGDDHA